MMRFSKPKYPIKQNINLAVQEIDQVKLKKVAISVVLCSICIILFVKFAVVDRFKEAEEIKKIYLEKEQQVQMIVESIQGQDEVQELYNKLNDTYLSASEAQEIDRIEIMNMIEQCILGKANIESIDINGNQVTVTVMDTTLTTISEIVAELELNEKTAYVTVFTAQTEKVEKSNGKVSADIMVQLKPEEENNE